MGNLPYIVARECVEVFPGELPSLPSPWYDVDWWVTLDSWAVCDPPPDPGYPVEYAGSACRIFAQYDTQAECLAACEGAT